MGSSSDNSSALATSVCVLVVVAGVGSKVLHAVQSAFSDSDAGLQVTKGVVQIPPVSVSHLGCLPLDSNSCRDPAGTASPWVRSLEGFRMGAESLE